MTKKPRRPSQSSSERRGFNLEDFLKQVHRFHEEGHVDEALSMMEVVPQHLQHRPEFLITRGMLYMDIGESSQAMRDFEEAGQADPHVPIPFFLLGMLYYDRDWMSHALRILRKARDMGDWLPESMVTEIDHLIEEAEAYIRNEAEKAGVSFKRMDEALHVAEQGERALSEGEHRQAARYFHRAYELMPEWPELRAHEALSLFTSGSEKEAIRAAEFVLEKKPDSVRALSYLIHFHIARQEMEQARVYEERLRALPLKDANDLELAINAYGLLNDDATLVSFCTTQRRYLKDLSPAALIILGSAAANQGDAKLARRMWRRAEEAGLPAEIIAPYRRALENGEPGPGIANRYPTVNLPSLISPHLLTEFFALTSELNQAEEDEDEAEIRRARRKIEGFVARTPRLLQAATQLLWEQPQPIVGLDTLFAIGSPAAIAEIERLAFGQVGPLNLRVRAAEMLMDLGALDPERPVRIWDEKIGEWRHMRPRWSIVEASEPLTLPPELRLLIDQGLEAAHRQEWDVAAEKMEAALALDPNQPVLHHNLAVVLHVLGKASEAIAHLNRALEIDPDYVFARCALALQYLSQDPQDIPAAQALLEPILEVPALTEEEMVYYHRALAQLAMAKERYGEAREYLDIALDIDPDNEVLRAQSDELWYQEMLHSPFWAKIREQREAKYRLPIHREAPLAECLSRFPRETLLAMARNTPIPRPYKMRKAELLQAVAAQLLQPAVLGSIVADLSETERLALRDVLEAGGMLSWDVFTNRYGNDLDESDDWSWHPPKTVMGRLRMFGLLSPGTVGDQFVVLVPLELRRLLPPLLRTAASSEAEKRSAD